MPSPFRTTRLVEFHDTDMAGIMHFAVFFQYMASAEHELFRSAGLSVFERVDGKPLSFPRVSASCDYLSPARCEDVLDIAVSIARMGTKSVTYEFAFTLEGRAVANGKMTSVCCVVEPGEPPRSVAIPPEFSEPLRAFLA